MRHAVNITIKFFGTGLLLYMVLGVFFEISNYVILLVTGLITAIDYMLDLLLVNRFGIWVAMIAIFVVSFSVIWAMLNLHTGLNNTAILQAASVASVALLIVEWFFHRNLEAIKVTEK